MREYSDRADWISIVLHFILGLFIGCFIGGLTVYRRNHGIWLRDDLILPYLSGCSLIVAGLGAMNGDQLWMGRFYLLMTGDLPRHSRMSYYLSVLTIGSGIVLSAYSLYRHFSGLM